MKGHIHSFESFGTVDGPGVRYVVFFQGCPMRCLYCHNPDTWNMNSQQLVESGEIIDNIKRNQMFYKTGGLTATGGEPLVQLDFLIELFSKAKQENIHTCLDTSGIVFSSSNQEVMVKFKQLVQVTDLVMLDIKHMDPEEHIKLTSKPNTNILKFARFLDENQVPMWIRHVVVPGITDHEDEWRMLANFITTLHNFKHLEVLPYHTMALSKYERLGIDYPLKGVEPLPETEAKRAYDFIMELVKSKNK